MVSIYGQLCIGGIGLIVSYVIMQKQQFYQAYILTYVPKLVNDYYNTIGPENTTLFLVLNIFFMISIISFLYSSPFKKKIWMNIPLVIWISLNLLYNTVIIFMPGLAMGALNVLTVFDSNYYLYIFFVSYGFGIIMFLFEEIIVKILIANIWEKRQRELEISTTF